MPHPLFIGIKTFYKKFRGPALSDMKNLKYKNLHGQENHFRLNFVNLFLFFRTDNKQNLKF